MLLSLACVALANALVPVIWHDGYPHRSSCRHPDCPYKAYYRMRMNGKYGAGGVIRWRRQAHFAIVDRFDDHTHTGNIAAQLAAETPVWAIDKTLLPGGIEEVFADLRRLAIALGVQTASSALDQASQCLGGLLGQLSRRTPSTASSGGVQVQDRDAMMVELRRRVYRAHRLAEQSTSNTSGIGRGWTEYFRSFGPERARATVRQHKDLVARYDTARAKVLAGIRQGLGTMDEAHRTEFSLVEREFEVLGEIVEQVARIYQVRVVKEEW